jgi:hypothetical protein
MIGMSILNLEKLIFRIGSSVPASPAEEWKESRDIERIRTKRSRYCDFLTLIKGSLIALLS